jgi:4-amino-4-deoxy-L-arabinose transferase-like glycosyltransferase
MKSLPEIIKIIANDTSPPLWNILEWAAFRIFGTDEVVIRSLSFTFFLGAVFFTYKIAETFWNKKTALLTSVLIFLNPFFFIYAFEGRMYSILALGVTASMYFFIKKNWVFYVIATLWALYSHHFAIFAVFLQGLYFLNEFFFGARKKAKDMLGAFLAVGIGYLPWAYPLYLQTSKVAGGFWLQTPNLKDLRNVIYDYLAEGIKSHPYKIGGFALHRLALWLVLAALLLRRWFDNVRNSSFLLVWFLGPILITYILSQFFQSIFFNRYLLYTIPPAMALLASKRRKVSNILIAIIVSFFLLIDWYYFTHPVKPPFDKLASFVKETRSKNSAIINWYSNGAHHIWETKYYGIEGPIYVPSGDELPFFVGTALMQEGDIVRKLPGAEKIGVITSGPVEEVILKGYTKNAVKSFDSLKIIWFEKE